MAKEVEFNYVTGYSTGWNEAMRAVERLTGMRWLPLMPDKYEQAGWPPLGSDKAS